MPEGWRYSQPSIHDQNETFCNITVSYTHPGQGDAIYVETWLPVNNYNGRLQAIGGGGWTAGRFFLSYVGMIGAVHDGYATATTDAGLGNSTFLEWGLVSPGNTNLYAIQNLGSVSLSDEAIIVKHFIEEYYRQPPSYSYWNGCSHGGRQGSMLAQRYPTAYDGIIAAAPAVYWAEVVLESMWPGFYMDSTGQYPNSCQLNQLTAFAVAECDADDGVQDGIIADPDSCLAKFDPTAHVGKEGSSLFAVQFNSNVDVARALWNGPVSSTGKKLWHGFKIGTDLSSLAATNCTIDGTCFGTATSVTDWIDEAFVAKDLTANLTSHNTSHQRFDYVYYSFKQQFDSLIGTHDPDYSAFKDAGGKMITYHGLADQSIPPDGTLNFYHEIANTVPDIESFYRYFKVPGLGHCWGGSGGQPITLFDQLRVWVENGTAPDSSVVTITKPNNSTQEQLICAYPKKAKRCFLHRAMTIVLLVKRPKQAMNVK
ncbi:hypothetical protein N0V90_011019 [Kalmusia sp. IMI 367209]|nr:hypothetical protein N0V90_011019 [Kalmusia sp. IMI 367209]